MIFVRYYLWVVPHLLLAVAAAIAFRRGWHRRLPIFFSFAVCEVLQFLTLFVLSRLIDQSSIAIYFWALAVSSAAVTVLHVGVLFELADLLFLSRASLRLGLRLVMRWTVAGMVLVASAASAGFSTSDLPRALRICEVVDFSSSLVQVGLLVALFLFSRALRISWRSWPFGIALGLGISACINLATAALRSALGHSALIAADVIEMAAFHVAVVVWLIYLRLPERTPAFAGRGLGESDIQMWDQELQRMARQ